jgi:hypothetical protein
MTVGLVSWLAFASMAIVVTLSVSAPVSASGANSVGHDPEFRSIELTGSDCSLESAQTIDSYVHSVYAGSTARGFNTSNLPIQATDSTMLAGWIGLCSTPAFVSVVDQGGPRNFTMGLSIHWANSTGEGSFSESWADSGSLVMETWDVSLGSGSVSGPLTKNAPISSGGGPAGPGQQLPGQTGPSTYGSWSVNWVPWFVLTLGSVSGFLTAGLVYSRNRRLP